MNNPQSQEIVARFYEALQWLYNDNGNDLRSLHDFSKRYQIPYSNLHKAMTDHSRQVFQIAWLTPLIMDFSISANWLMTGSGSMVFKSPPVIVKYKTATDEEVKKHIQAGREVHIETDADDLKDIARQLIKNS